MGSYYTRANFSLRTQYSIDLTLTTSYVSGGTQVYVGNQAVKHTSVSNAPTSSGSPRSYSTPNGRAGSVGGNLAESGSDSAWAFTFTTGSVPQYQNIWGTGGFTRFYPDSVSIGTINVSASHSLLGSASASIGSIKHVFRTTFDPNGGDGGSYSVDEDSGYLLFLPTPTRSGYNFLGWTSGGTNYGTSTYTVNATRTLTASWQIATPAPVFTHGVDNWSVLRIGDSPSDYIQATDTTSYELTSGPPGVSLTASGSGVWIGGTITDTPTPSTQTFTVTATGPGGSTDSSDTFSLRAALPVWTDTTLSNARVGTSYTSGNSFSASGATSWTITGVPAGLSTSGTTTSTVTLTGTPTSAGDYTITATPYNRDGTSASDAGTTQYISLSVLPRVPVWVDQSIDTTNARKGVAYFDTLTANYVTNWDDGALPSGGLSFSGTTNSVGTAFGDISGTPTAYGPITFTITPSNSAGETAGARTFTINVKDALLVWQNQVLAASVATQDESYLDGVSVQTGPTATYTVYSGSLPPGITLDDSTGVISGTPTTPGTYPFVIRATNLSNETADTQELTIVVESAGGYVQVKTASGWQNALVYVKTAGGWVEGTVNLKSGTGWGPSFTS